MKNLKERTKTQQDSLDGKRIQYKYIDTDYQDWITCIREPLFEWHIKDYRVEPKKPMKVWINTYKDDNNIYVYKTKKEALSLLDNSTRYNLIKSAAEFKEVIK